MAVTCYDKALSINPMFENSWFIMGCAAMHIDEYDKAIRAFNRVTILDPENGEAWNNLASVYIKQKKLRESFRCIRESLRHSYDASNVWENYLFVAVDLKEYSEAVRALDRVFTIRCDNPRMKDRAVDFEVLDIVVLAVINDMKDSNGESVKLLVPRVKKLLDNIATKISTPKFFTTYARFEQSQGHLRSTLQFYQKAYRSVLNHPELSHDETVFKLVANCTFQLVEGYIELGPQDEEVRVGGTIEKVCKEWAYESCQVLKAVIGRAKVLY